MGTFTRAKRRSPVSGSLTIAARLSARFEMYGNGWAGLDSQRSEHREDPTLEHLAQLVAIAQPSSFILA